MDWLRSLILPMQGSAYAAEVDTFYMFLVWLSVFFFLLIAGIATYSVIHFRHKPGNVTPHWTHNNLLEFIWTRCSVGYSDGHLLLGFKRIPESVSSPRRCAGNPDHRQKMGMAVRISRTATALSTSCTFR